MEVTCQSFLDHELHAGYRMERRWFWFRRRQFLLCVKCGLRIDEP